MIINELLPLKVYLFAVIDSIVYHRLVTEEELSADETSHFKRMQNSTTAVE